MLKSLLITYALCGFALSSQAQTLGRPCSEIKEIREDRCEEIKKKIAERKGKLDERRSELRKRYEQRKDDAKPTPAPAP